MPFYAAKVVEPEVRRDAEVCIASLVSRGAKARCLIGRCKCRVLFASCQGAVCGSIEGVTQVWFLMCPRD